jgi:hypothetical protein
MGQALNESIVNAASNYERTESGKIKSKRSGMTYEPGKLGLEDAAIGENADDVASSLAENANINEEVAQRALSSSQSLGQAQKKLQQYQNLSPGEMRSQIQQQEQSAAKATQGIGEVGSGYESRIPERDPTENMWNAGRPANYEDATGAINNAVNAAGGAAEGIGMFENATQNVGADPSSQRYQQTAQRTGPAGEVCPM